MGVLRSESAVRGIWAAVVTGLVAIVVTTLTIFIGQSAGEIPSPGPTATTTVTATVTATATTTTTITASPSSSPDGTSEMAPETYLDELEPIEDSLNSETATLGGVEYLHALTNPMASCSQVGPVTWVLPVSATRLLGEVGVGLDAAEPEARVAFLVKSGTREVYSEVFDVGQHGPIDVQVSAGDRLTIETRFIPEGGFRGNCNTEATAVWGDLRVADR